MKNSDEGEEVKEEVDYVPEREWWKRTHPIEVLPKQIAGEFHAVRKKFGMDIANLVLFVYNEWGPDVAKALAKRILMFDNHGELFRFLVSKIDLFDERSRTVLSALLHMYKYRYYIDELFSIVSNYEKTCPGLRDKSLALFHFLAVRGHYYTPECIVFYSMHVLKCKDVSESRCRKVFEHIERMVSKEHVGSKE